MTAEQKLAQKRLTLLQLAEKPRQRFQGLPDAQGIPEPIL